MLPFTSVADIKLTEGQSTIKRKNRKRTVNVSADVNEKEGNAKDIMDDLEARFLPKLMSKYEVSYKIEGQSEERRDSFKSMFVTFPLALFGIYFIIASMFRSYIQPVVIMTTIPFGLIGGIIGHIIFGRALTIMSFFGMVALAGIVVNDAIVLIEGINMRLDSGMPFLEAIREGGKRRFRAILLTTITTFFGLMPMILEKSMQAQFLIPMAISIAFGVAFATLLTLILIPCLLAILNDIRRICHFAWFLKMPSREAVEPRSESRT
jgi:multidrug efflux pump subunit AcrB